VSGSLLDPVVKIMCLRGFGNIVSAGVDVVNKYSQTVTAHSHTHIHTYTYTHTHTHTHIHTHTHTFTHTHTHTHSHIMFAPTHVVQVLDALLSAIDSNEEAVALEAMTGLAKVFELVDEGECDCCFSVVLYS
jgi:carbohydrate-binding DOMON domain-containing protein